MGTEQMMLQCRQTLEQVKNINENLQTIGAIPIAEDESQLEILKETEKRLKAELQSLRERDVGRLPQSREVQTLCLQQQEDKDLMEYTETLALLRAERAGKMDVLRESQDECARLHQINKKLKRKLEVVQQSENDESSDTQSVEAAVAEMHSRVETASEVAKYFHSALKNILDKQFSPADTRDVRKTLNESQDIDASHVLTLKHIVGRLIEQSINSPEQPYITRDQQTWPAQVEFLLRTQIAAKHPEDPQKIRLVPFHL